MSDAVSPWEQPLAELNYLYGKPSAKALFKEHAEDFMVDEELGFELDGEGEHVCIHIIKRGVNTQAVAKAIAKHAQVAPREVAYAGQKDRQGVCSQWFSVPVPIKKHIDFSALNDESIFVTEQQRHGRRLRLGCHRGNHFKIRLREVDEPLAVLSRINAVRQGVPNYFGEQRFGHGGHNLTMAQRMFQGERIRDKKLRSMVISAARSYIFNQIVSLRVAEHGLAKTLQHEVFMLSGSNAFFTDAITPENITRLVQGDIELSAPMVGKGDKALVAQERQWLAPFNEWCTGLAQLGLKGERRMLRLYPENLTVAAPSENVIELSFSLKKGCFATALLRELVDYRQSENSITRNHDENIAK
ncbi:tRNA pseudouridine synthase D [Pseudoalteromonas sp. THAF3]|uniref:tRNA pseudouridine(13) synthase TruD n=1 Tax=Pseudoalteromonas sp. THAF3 TaxID=2587843 RepID=UPI001268C002|nr:tRNA pseudouridine(13) synthase TruD [Pseudoalteromonas sp. THAF3]QFU05669.1 tRNA pseudouridine synthase D [Pseudoalteromonas sp. THAF3]